MICQSKPVLPALTAATQIRLLLLAANAGSTSNPQKPKGALSMPLKMTPSLRISNSNSESSDLRPSWDSYFISLLPLIATRSTCLRRKVSAILTLNNRIIGTGYNGSLPGYPHCSDPGVGCIRLEQNIPSGERLDICRAVHAETNAIDFSTRDTAGSTLYCTLSPCKFCAQRIVSAGIIRVVFLENYPNSISTEILTYSGISLEMYKG